MTLDDDSILSAYLDGELGPDQQQAVESALFAEPQLAEELKSLALLRDLVAGLPRDVPPDVTARVMRRVRRRARLGTAREIIAWAPVRAGLVAVAASVLLVIALPWFVHVGHGPAGGQAPIAKVRPVEDGPPVITVDRWPTFPHPAGSGPSAPIGSEGHRSPEAGSDEGDGSDAGELSHVREYLDNPQLRRIFMVSDPGDGSAERKVASIVEQTTRFNYLRITVSQGIVIDPRHPDQATVFAVVVGPRELHRLGEQLRVALKDRVEDTEPEPAVVTQLADISQVRACPPLPIAEMNIPREALLAYQHAGGGDNAPEAPRAEPPKTVKRPIPEQYHSMPNPELVGLVPASGASVGPGPRRPAAGGGQSAGRPPAADDADQSLVVLVWVSRPRPG